MNLKFQYDATGIDWNLVPEILKEVGMAYHSGERHQQAFSKSHAMVFVWDGNLLIGFGRAISDGILQAALYDVAVLPAYQGKGIGKAIVEKLVSQCPGCNIILYASPGKEQFYEKLRFRKMKTAMALFTDAEKKRERGFTE
jgi:ribosomal protein S18 acetylase RimI-like enzyme